MIDPIRHYLLTALPTVHDEEAMTALELIGRTSHKINEVIEKTNENTELIEKAEREMPQLISAAVDKKTSEEFRNFYEIMDDLVESIPKDAQPVRPGTVANGSIVSGMLGGDLSELRQNHYFNMSNKWTGGNGFYHADDRVFVTHSGYTVSAALPVEYGQYFKITTHIFGNQVRPVALFDANMRCVAVVGETGKGSWDAVVHDIVIDRGDVKYMRVVCGNGHISSMRVEYYKRKDFSIAEINLATREHWHLHAMKRTNTVTDRAQIKTWFKHPYPGMPFAFTLSWAMAKYQNIAEEGITVRLFAATTDSTYDLSLPETAAGYTFLRSRAIDTVNFTVPGEINGEPVTHICAFLDFLPEDGNKFMDVWMLPPRLEYAAGSITASYPQIHGGLATDYVNVVRAGAALSGAYRKKIVGLGDSLMRGNTLPQWESWFNRAAGALDMEHYNLAANGMPIAGTDSMLSTFDTVVPDMTIDYFVLQGGANDFRLNVPLETFKAGIREIIRKVRTQFPGVKILCCTNWRRTTNLNGLGLYDWEYVAAMMEECEDLGVPCINNYKDGLNLLADGVKNWADEGTVTLGTPNIHFSRKANIWVAEKYINAIMAL